MTLLVPLLAALLAAPSQAEELVLPELDPAQTLAACLANDTDVRNYVHGYYRDDDAREEFKRLYAAYARTVVKRRNEGWSNGEVGNFKTNWINAWQRYRVLALFENAPQWDESRTRLEALIDQTKRKAAAAQGPEKEALLKQLAEYQEFAAGRFGVCNDWQHEVAASLRSAGPRRFVVRETMNEGSNASTSHAYVLVCPQSDAAHCVAFDPWKHGTPELYTDTAIARGPNEAHGCFTDAPPPGAR